MHNTKSSSFLKKQTPTRPRADTKRTLGQLLGSAMVLGCDWSVLYTVIALSKSKITSIFSQTLFLSRLTGKYRCRKLPVVNYSIFCPKKYYRFFLNCKTLEKYKYKVYICSINSM